jgi:hypothetical protein
MAREIESLEWSALALKAITDLAAARQKEAEAKLAVSRAETEINRLAGRNASINELTDPSYRYFQCDGRPPVDGRDGGMCTNVVRHWRWTEPLPTEMVCESCQEAAAAEKAKRVEMENPAPPAEAKPKKGKAA